MRRGLSAALCCLAAANLAAARPAAADVRVEFVAPGGYTDANLESRYRGPASPYVLHEFEAHLVRLGRLYLASDELLAIQVLDIDLAGEIDPAAPLAHGGRVLRSAAWPRITLSYVLYKDGRILRQAREVITDSAYLGGGAHPGHAGTLYYEKRMLDDWFRRHFAR